jgi:hypothetical protein
VHDAGQLFEQNQRKHFDNARTKVCMLVWQVQVAFQSIFFECLLDKNAIDRSLLKVILIKKIRDNFL